MKVKALIEILKTFDSDAEVLRYQWNDLYGIGSYEYVECVEQVTNTLLPDGTVYNEVHIGG